MTERALRFGVIGLSRGFDLTRPTLAADPRCRLVAAADPRPQARVAFAAEFAARTYETAEELCADPEVEVVYVASPHELHAEHAILAARAGKHLLVEKPMAITLAEARAMDAAARAAGVQMIVGPSHGFDPPVGLAAELIATGDLGRPRMITMLTYTDFLYRPRRGEELDTRRGGGVVFSQAVHQLDVVRRLADAPIVSVRAATGRWDPARPTEGACQAFLRFAGGASAVITYSGYGRYDTDALMGWIGETGVPRDPTAYGLARQRLAQAEEAGLKAARAYGSGAAPAPSPAASEHFGFVLVSCERGDLRLTPSSVEVYDERTRRTLPLPPVEVTRTAVIDEVWAAAVEGRTPRHSAAWGAETLAACLAILRSAEEDREIMIETLETHP